MHVPQGTQQFGAAARQSSAGLDCALIRRSVLVTLCLTLLGLSGCAAMRPMDGVPARYLPEELRGVDRAAAQRVDLSRLGQPTPAHYRVDAGDVLAIYIESVLGQREQPPINRPIDPSQPPTLGYPLTVRDDGMLSLPLVAPINVRGRTIPEIEQQIRHAYTVQRRLLRSGQERILVTLQQPRQYRVLVVREESEDDFLSGVSIGSGNIGRAKRGNSQAVSLPAYKNDVLHALVQSGGLPGLDAEAVVYVIRAQRGGPGMQACQTPPPVASHAGFRPPSYRPPGYASAAGTVPYGYGPAAYGGPASYGAPQNLNPMPGQPQQYAMPPQQQPLQPIPEQQPFSPGPGPGPGHSPIARPYPAGVPGQAFPPGTMIRGQSPDVSAQSLDGTQSGGRFQQMSRRIMSSPRRMAEQITGIPLPRITVETVPATGPVQTSQITPVRYSSPPPMSNNSYSNTNTNIPTTFPTNAGRPPVVPACDTCGPTPMLQNNPGNWQPPAAWSNVNMIASGALRSGSNVIRIPLRLTEYEPLQISQCDVILGDGDIVFIGSRDDEVFYTGGLLGGGEYNLPRDRNLDILEAIAIAESASQSAAGAGRSALNNDVSISPSQAIVLRRLPNNTQVPILVNLYRAREHLSERINIQPGDYILLQYTKAEAVGAFIERHILESALFGVAAAQFNSN
jgi:hypothetical protein